MEKEFVSGLYPRARNPKAPEFILANGSINLKQMIEFCQAKLAAGEEWVNYDVLQPKDASKRPYATVNNWKRNSEKQAEAQPTQIDDQGIDTSQIPFWYGNKRNASRIQRHA